MCIQRKAEIAASTQMIVCHHLNARIKEANDCNNFWWPKFLRSLHQGSRKMKTFGDTPSLFQQTWQICGKIFQVCFVWEITAQGNGPSNPCWQKPFFRPILTWPHWPKLCSLCPTPATKFIIWEANCRYGFQKFGLVDVAPQRGLVGRAEAGVQSEEIRLEDCPGGKFPQCCQSKISDKLLTGYLVSVLQDCAGVVNKLSFSQY